GGGEEPRLPAGPRARRDPKRDGAGRGRVGARRWPRRARERRRRDACGRGTEADPLLQPGRARGAFEPARDRGLGVNGVGLNLPGLALVVIAVVLVIALFHAWGCRQQTGALGSRSRE